LERERKDAYAKNSVSEIRNALDQWGVFFSWAKHTGWIRDGNCRKV